MVTVRYRKEIRGSDQGVIPVFWQSTVKEGEDTMGTVYSFIDLLKNQESRAVLLNLGAPPEMDKSHPLYDSQKKLTDLDVFRAILAKKLVESLDQLAAEADKGKRDATRRVNALGEGRRSDEKGKKGTKIPGAPQQLEYIESVLGHDRQHIKQQRAGLSPLEEFKSTMEGLGSVHKTPKKRLHALVHKLSVHYGANPAYSQEVYAENLRRFLDTMGTKFTSVDKEGLKPMVDKEGRIDPIETNPARIVALDAAQSNAKLTSTNQAKAASQIVEQLGKFMYKVSRDTEEARLVGEAFEKGNGNQTASLEIMKSYATGSAAVTRVQKIRRLENMYKEVETRANAIKDAADEQNKRAASIASMKLALEVDFMLDKLGKEGREEAKAILEKSHALFERVAKDKKLKWEKVKLAEVRGFGDLSDLYRASYAQSSADQKEPGSAETLKTQNEYRIKAILDIAKNAHDADVSKGVIKPVQYQLEPVFFAPNPYRNGRQDLVDDAVAELAEDISDLVEFMNQGKKTFIKRRNRKVTGEASVLI